MIALQINSEPLSPVALEYLATNSRRIRRNEIESAPPNSQVSKVSAVLRSIFPEIAASAMSRNGAIDAFSESTCNSPATGIPYRMSALRTAPFWAGDLKITAICDQGNPSCRCALCNLSAINEASLAPSIKHSATTEPAISPRELWISGVFGNSPATFSRNRCTALLARKFSFK